LRVLRFAVVGLINTLVALGVIFAMKWTLSLGDAWANLIGYGFGLIISFALNRRWTFRFQGPSLTAVWKFCGVVLAAYGLNLALVMAAVSSFEVNSYVAQTLGVLPYSLLTYFGFKHLVFSDPPRSATSVSQPM